MSRDGNLPPGVDYSDVDPREVDHSVGAELIFQERLRQMNEEGWTTDHDDKHLRDELSRAAICYAMPGYLRKEKTTQLNSWIGFVFDPIRFFWPPSWDRGWLKWNSENRIRELVKAGALIAAEIDRLVRKEQRK